MTIRTIHGENWTENAAAFVVCCRPHCRSTAKLLESIDLTAQHRTILKGRTIISYYPEIFEAAAAELAHGNAYKHDQSHGADDGEVIIFKFSAKALSPDEALHHLMEEIREKGKHRHKRKLQSHKI